MVKLKHSLHSVSILTKPRSLVPRVEGLILSLVILCLGLIQVTLLDAFRFLNLRPDLLLASSLAACLCLDFRAAFIFSVLAGFIKDAFGALPFGVNILLFPLWSFTIAKLSGKISIDHDLIRLVLALIFIITHNITCAVISVYLGRSVPFGLHLRFLVIGSLYTAAVFPLVFKINKTILSRR